MLCLSGAVLEQIAALDSRDNMLLKGQRRLSMYFILLFTTSWKPIPILASWLLLKAVCFVQSANVVINRVTGAPCVTFYLITLIVCRSVGPFHARKLGQTIQAFVCSSLAGLSHCKQLPRRWAVSTQALFCWLSDREWESLMLYVRILTALKGDQQKYSTKVKQIFFKIKHWHLLISCLAQANKENWQWCVNLLYI